MVLVKIFDRFLLFVFVKIGPEKVFGKTVNKKLASKDYKNIDLSFFIFVKGQSIVVVKNMKFIPLFFFVKTEFGGVVD